MINEGHKLLAEAIEAYERYRVLMASSKGCFSVTDIAAAEIKPKPVKQKKSKVGGKKRVASEVHAPAP